MNTKQEPWDFSTILRLLGIVWLAGLYLEMTRWTTHLNLVSILLLLGFGFGLLLGKSRFRVWQSTLFMIGSGWFFIFLIVPFATEATGSLFRKQLIFLTRLGIAFGQLVAGKPVLDVILFMTILAVIAWLLGILIGYVYHRTGKPWLGVGLMATVIFTIEVFLPAKQQNGLISAAFILVVVLLVTRIFYIEKKAEWIHRRIEFHEESGFDLSRQVIMNSLLIVVVAWSLPSVIKAFIPGTLENDRLQTLLERVSGGAKNIVSSLDIPAEEGTVVFTPYFALGTQIPSSEQQVFAVEASAFPPGGYHFYWKSRTFDHYEAGEWSNGQSVTGNYSANHILVDIAERSNLIRYTFRFKILQRSGSYFFAGIPYAINSSGKIIYGGTATDEKDIISVLPNKVLLSGEVYQTIGWVNWASEEELRNSDQYYPQWITERYLQVPDDFPPQVTRLAESITSGFSNPYDKVIAITNYLRENITYEAAIASVPEGEDEIAWFLFITKKGFCTYYATAEVMMLRSIGIPSRLAIGYTQGEASASGKLFRVRAKNSHAWPEVYFNGIGWIEFEPTTTIAPQVIPPASLLAEIQPTITSDQEFEQLTFEGESSSEFPLEDEVVIGHKASAKSVYLILGIVFFFIGSLLVISIIWYRKVIKREKLANFPRFMLYIYASRNKKAPRWLENWAWQIEQPKIEKLFTAIPNAAKTMRLRLRTSQTPAEKVGILVAKLPEATQEATILLEEYQKAIYGDRGANLRSASTAARRIRSLARRKAIMGTFRHK